MTTTNDPQIGLEILNQLRGMDRMCLHAWGAFNSPKINPVILMPDGLKFKTQGLVAWKGYVYIRYDYGTDLYTVEFAKIRKFEWKVEKKVEGVYFDQLAEIINRQVG
tara:strand:+ start:993 stop:1313 length:321 start_codon:yes stop_codon:yes gene_type:complete